MMDTSKIIFNIFYQRILLTLILSSTFITCTYAQNGYALHFQINGLSDTVTYLGYYYGESTYIRDTAQVSKDGTFSFLGNNELDMGVYFVVLNKTRLFDFVIGKNHSFTIKTDTTNYIANMKVVGDEENKLYFENVTFNIERNREAKPFLEVLKDSTSSAQAKEEAKKAFKKIDKRVIDYQKKLIDKYPGRIITKMLQAKQPIDIPKTQDKSDSTFSYRYVKSHYWDLFDLADPTFIHMPTPMYKEKVYEYLDKLVVPQADSVIGAIDMMVNQAKQHQETYKYMIWSLTLKYQKPEIMGLDRVFVHLYDRYYASREMDYWANASLVKNIKETAEKLRLSLLGMKAQNLIMQDQNLKPKSLYDIPNKYTVIYFYDPDCGFCKKETPKLKRFYETTAFDVEIFAVSADTSMQKMKNYIQEMELNWVSVNGPRTYTKSYQKMYDAFTTPTIYVLDEKKTIIAKKIGAAKIEEFLMNYEKNTKHSANK